ncbi:MAG: glutathione S-transferase [Boseongicola sp.]|nr:MAG: glutathione S-transferase [Boseongicola sp.]
MKLYWAANTISTASVIALEEGGVHWESFPVDFGNAEQTRPQYLALNPKGRVPALATPEGIVTETGAILEYLAATVVPGLVPVDPLQAARMREVMYYIASTMHVNHAHRMRGPRWAIEESSFADMKAKVTENMAASCAYLEPQIEKPFLFGPDLTLADCWLYPAVQFLKGDGVDVEDYPRLAAWKAAMDARPSVITARQKGLLG